jgi:hypothetical protein
MMAGRGHNEVICRQAPARKQLKCEEMFSARWAAIGGFS